jgi:outer membrane protein assembly factor BamB
VNRFLVALLALAGTASAADWPQLLGPNRDATSTEKSVPTNWEKTPLTALWQREVGAGFSSPVVAGGKLILFHRVGDKETVACLDAATGKQTWSFDYATDYQDPLGKGDGPRSTPTIAGDKVYTLGPGGVLTCLEFATGKKVWQHDLAKMFKLRPSYFGIGSSPLVEGDLLVLNVGDPAAGIVAWNKKTGEEVWRATNQDASYASPVAATLDGRRRLIFFTREGLVGIDPASGKVVFEKRWRARYAASVNAATPVIIGDHLFLSACYEVGAILLKVERDTLKEVWNNDESLSCHFSTPVRVGDYLFGFDGREEQGARLRCIEWATGKVRWSADGYGCGSIVRVGDKLLVLSQNGRLEALEANPERRVVLAKQDILTGPVRAHLALADGVLFARDGKKFVALGFKK